MCFVHLCLVRIPAAWLAQLSHSLFASALPFAKKGSVIYCSTSAKHSGQWHTVVNPKVTLTLSLTAAPYVPLVVLAQRLIVLLLLLFQVLGLRGFGLLPESVEHGQGITRSSASSPPIAHHRGFMWSHALCATANHLDVSSSTCSCSGGRQHGALSDNHGGSSSANCATRCVSSCCLCKASVSPLASAVASLPKLVCLSVCSVRCGGVALQLDAAAASVLAGASGLSSLQLSDVGLTNDAVEALLRGGLTQLRRLVLDNNMALTSAMLPGDLAATCTQLRELSVLRTGIRADAAAFKGRILRLNPHVAIKSSAR